MAKIRLYLTAGIAVAALAAAACSESGRPLSPVGPSPNSNFAASADDAGAASGTMARTFGAATDKDVVAEWAASVGWMALDGFVVEGSDVITLVTGLCPDKTITVRGVAVKVNAMTEYVGQASCAGLIVGRTVRVRGVVTPTPAGLSVVATRIQFEGAPPPPTEVEVSGVVASFTGACPALTITLRGTGAVIVTSMATTFDPSCAAVAVGKSVEAAGVRNAAGQLAATRLRVRTDEGGGGRRTVNGEGPIGDVNGTCPTLTLVIRGYRVSTTMATVYVNGVCADLRPGTQVDVTGETEADGSVVATRIVFLRVPGRPVSGDGTVSQVTGVCPTLTMTVQGFTVTTSLATVFTGGTCASIRPGVHVIVTGTETAGVIAATTVAIDPPGRRD